MRPYAHAIRSKDRKSSRDQRRKCRHEPGAYWLLLGPEGAELQRTDYDLELAAARIRDTDYPQANDFAEHYVLHPPTEEAMLAVFSGKR